MIPRFKPSLGISEFTTLFRRNRGAVHRFEKDFAKSFGVVDAVAFPYGRSAQWAFFKSMGIENAEIIMPAYTCSVVAHAVTLSGNTPRFIDIDLYDYNMNLDKAELAINKNTRAIIATHTFGYPQDLNRLESIIKRGEERYGHKIWLMQDCCHAFGAEWQGRPLNSSGDVAVYALNVSKLITAIFGGMLTFNDQTLANRVRAWRDLNYKKASWKKSFQRRLYLLTVYLTFTENLYGITWWLQEKTDLLNRFTKAFHLDDKICFPPDYLNKMTDVEAAVGLIQLKKYPKIIERRRANAKLYSKILCNSTNWILPPIIDGATYSHYVVRVPDRKQVKKDWANKGIELGELIQYSIPDTNAYAHLNQIHCKNALRASRSTVNFPLHCNLIRRHGNE